MLHSPWIHNGNLQTAAPDSFPAWVENLPHDIKALGEFGFYVGTPLKGQEVRLLLGFVDVATKRASQKTNQKRILMYENEQKTCESSAR